MPTELEGAVQLRVALKRFAPDLSKETQTQMATALKTVTTVARGYVPSDGAVLSGWTKNLSGADNFVYRPFPKFNSVQAKAGITYSTSPSKPNKNGFTSIASVFNKSAAGAIYEAAGRIGPQKWVGPKAGGSGKGVSRSNWSGAGEQFIQNLPPLTSSLKGRGRLIYRAWAANRGLAEGITMKAISTTTEKFYARSKAGQLGKAA
jgi:hypothetical protein